MFITAFLEQLHPDILETANLFLALSETPARLIQNYSSLIVVTPGALAPPQDGETHQAAIWWREKGPPTWLKRIEPKGEHLRHQRTYLDGEMDADMRFYFRGPDDKLNLGVQNLRMFIQVAEGLDDDTWLHHLKQGDYANWFREVIHDDELAAFACRVQKDPNLSAEESRQELAKYITQKYETGV